MGQKIRPTGFRVGIMTGWQSEWFANKGEFSELLVEDQKIRKFLKRGYKTSKGGRLQYISKIKIERTREKVIVVIHSSRVGLIIGQKGAEIERLTKALEDLTHRHIEIKTMEVSRPETDAQLISEDIAEQLEKRTSFRRCMKQAMERAMENGARGIKLQLAGRLGGSEMARCELAMRGSIPLSTLRTKVEYGFTEATTPQGNIGIKVWINNGDYLNPDEPAAAGDAPPPPRRRGPRPGGDRPGGDRGGDRRG